ncbi:MerR family transcriptional regulator [Spirillospora sp. NBC_01491]|uniref:MerR family transcriptional regulator n=1 Tax=Spirillospora sp. NBC_01491 TaxID=2976007 RepID=UPI002E2FD77B|nr:MerR family transcriptional regulator [Spirillospora sp. NBC_01491]
MISPEVKPCRWGWVAVMHCPMGGDWCRPGEAARIVGVPVGRLRYWADRALISMVYHPGKHRLYYRDELAMVVGLAGGVGLTNTALLELHVARGLYR